MALNQVPLKAYGNSVGEPTTVADYTGDSTNFIESEGDIVGKANNQEKAYSPYAGVVASEEQVLNVRNPNSDIVSTVIDMYRQEALPTIVWGAEGTKNVFNEAARISISGKITGFPGADTNPDPMTHKLFGADPLSMGR